MLSLLYGLNLEEPLPAKWCFCFLICSLDLLQLSFKEQASLNFKSAVTIRNDFGAQENKICHYFHFPPSIYHKIRGPDAMIFVFWMLSFNPTFSLSPFTMLYISSSLSAIRVVSFTYLRLLIFLLSILIPACDSYSLAFHIMYSAYKLNHFSILASITPWTVWKGKLQYRRWKNKYKLKYNQWFVGQIKGNISKQNVNELKCRSYYN